MEFTVALDTLLSQWKQIGEYETLEACRKGYDENQKSLPDEEWFQDVTRSQLKNEGVAKPSSEQVRSRAGLLRGAVEGTPFQKNASPAMILVSKENRIIDARICS